MTTQIPVHESTRTHGRVALRRLWVACVRHTKQKLARAPCLIPAIALTRGHNRPHVHNKRQRLWCYLGACGEKRTLGNVPVLGIMLANDPEFHHRCLRAGKWGEKEAKGALEHSGLGGRDGCWQKSRVFDPALHPPWARLAADLYSFLGHLPSLSLSRASWVRWLSCSGRLFQRL